MSCKEIIAGFADVTSGLSRLQRVSEACSNDVQDKQCTTVCITSTLFSSVHPCTAISERMAWEPRSIRFSYSCHAITAYFPLQYKVAPFMTKQTG